MKKPKQAKQAAMGLITQIEPRVRTNSDRGGGTINIYDGSVSVYVSGGSQYLSGTIDTIEALFCAGLEAIAEHRTVLAAVRAGQKGTP